MMEVVMNDFRNSLMEKYKALVRRFIEALSNNSPAKEIDRINKEIKQTILQMNQAGV
jgi:hypothetical protein